MKAAIRISQQFSGHSMMKMCVYKNDSLRTFWSLSTGANRMSLSRVPFSFSRPVVKKVAVSHSFSSQAYREPSHRDTKGGAANNPLVETERYPCGSPHHEDDLGVLPPPLPEPRYSAHKRVMPSMLTPFSSAKGREMLLDVLRENTAESYFTLMEHFVNQSEPAFCGVTTLLMVLNAMCVDPQVRWRGGWRYYGNEDMLLGRCCLSPERIRRVGISVDEFRVLAECQGLRAEMKRPEGDTSDQTLEGFRDDIRRVLTVRGCRSILVVSFSRQCLDQTGDGHFSPLAAFHEETDSVLLLDVARFKYPPYWVTVEDLYKSMVAEDTVTGRSRGWFVLHPPENHACCHGAHEARRPAELVAELGDPDVCPVGDVRVTYCKANPSNSEK